MEFALLIYLTEMLGTLNETLKVLSILCAIAAVGFTMSVNADFGETVERSKRFLKFSIIALAVSWSLLILLPSKKTVYMMVGAYAAQKVVQSPDVVGIYSRIIRLVEAKLDEAIEKK